MGVLNAIVNCRWVQPWLLGNLAQGRIQMTLCRLTKQRAKTVTARVGFGRIVHFATATIVIRPSGNGRCED